MQQHKLVWSLLESPDKISPYNNLYKYFVEKHMENEASAVVYLIEKKFSKKHANSPDLN